MPFNSPNMSQQNVRTFGRIDSLASLNPSKIFPAILFVTDIWGLKGQCQGMGDWARISVNFDFGPPWTEIKICQKYCKSSRITAIFPWDIKFTAWGRRRDIFLLAARVIFAKDTLEWVFWRFVDEELWWFRPRSSRPWDFDLEINSQLLLVLFFFRFSLGNCSRTPGYVD